jgi:GxxExxY protein
MREPTFDAHTYAIIGACFEVHSVLGHRFMEKAYHRALEHELQARGIPFMREVEAPLWYKTIELGAAFRADFLCGDVILEVKALPQLGRNEYRQLTHYVTSTRSRAGLLVNFGSSSLEVERFDNPSHFPTTLSSNPMNP